jgi:protein-disulfide isomerase
MALANLRRYNDAASVTRQLIAGAVEASLQHVVCRESTNLNLFQARRTLSHSVGRTDEVPRCWESERMVVRFRRCRPRRLRLAVFAGLLAAGASARAEQTPAPQLFVTGAVPDASGETITISGGNFGTRPFVTLDLVPLEIRAAIDTLIVAAAPVGAAPAAEYLLTVSRGPAASENASFQVTLGAAGPSRPDAAKGLQPGRNARGTPEPSNPGAGALPPLTAVNGPAAQVGDRVFSMEEVDREWRRSDPSSYMRLTRQIYDLRRRTVETMVTDELLAREAAARGVNVEALLAEEVPRHIVAMPDSAVISLYQSLGDNTRGATFDQMRPALRAWLERHSEPELAKLNFIEELKKVSTRAKILLETPRVQIERAAQDVALGPEAALVEIVAFGDFQSAEYARFAQVFSRVRDTFGDRIRFVFKNLPVLGPQSVAAAEAALCANAQGRFWAYHDALVAPGVVDAARITKSATAVGLKRDAFTGCVERREYRDVIRSALDEADRYGIGSSPSFLVNGRLAPPPPPFLAAFDYFKLLIEEELGRLSASR